MAKKKRKKIKYPIFVFSLVIGLGLVAVGFVQPDVIFGSQTISVPGLDILSVDIDPTTQAILGDIVFGAPNVVPLERSGALLTAAGLGQCNDPLGNIRNTAPRDYIFGRQLSGDPNISPIWHAYNGNECAYGYMEWDLTDVPDDFTASGLRFQLEVTSVPSILGGCYIVNVDDSFAQIGQENFIQRIRSLPTFRDPSGSQGFIAPFPLDFYVAGISTIGFQPSTWCNTVGLKTFQWGEQIPRLVGSSTIVFDVSEGPKAFNRAVTGDNKFTIAIMPKQDGNSGSGTWALNYDYWKTEGSLIVSGSSNPITCATGFELQNFICVPVQCSPSQSLNLTSNQCEDFACPSGQQINNQTGICEGVVCPAGQTFNGSSCQDLTCGVGFEISGNQCVIKTCNTGFELIEDNCQAIQCTTPNTVLVGNNCVERMCPLSQVQIDGVCRELVPVNGTDPVPTECASGFKPVGNTCVQEPQNCPEGTVAFENICVQRIPSLLSLSGDGLLSPEVFIISGAVVSLMSIAGIIIRRI